jgi:hypothetical protein
MRQSSGVDKHLTAIAFADESRGIAAGAEGTLLYTSTRTNLGPGNRPDQLAAITLLAASATSGKFWVTGLSGNILHSSDGGRSWEKQQSNSTSHLYAVAFVDEMHGWAAGADGNILHTSDGGATWNAQISNSSQLFNAISFVDEKDGWAAGEGGVILASNDGG